MKTFGEFIGKNEAKSVKAAIPSFREVLEGEGKTSCISENIMEMMKEMYEGMCKEMKSCHEDETERTAESYLKECESKVSEVMEGLLTHCKECMAAGGAA